MKTFPWADRAHTFWFCSTHGYYKTIKYGFDGRTERFSKTTQTTRLYLEWFCIDSEALWGVHTHPTRILAISNILPFWPPFVLSTNCSKIHNSSPVGIIFLIFEIPYGASKVWIMCTIGSILRTLEQCIFFLEYPPPPRCALRRVIWAGYSERCTLGGVSGLGRYGCDVYWSGHGVTFYDYLSHLNTFSLSLDFHDLSTSMYTLQKSWNIPESFTNLWRKMWISKRFLNCYIAPKGEDKVVVRGYIRIEEYQNQSKCVQRIQNNHRKSC